MLEKSPSSSASTSSDWREMYTESPARKILGQEASNLPVCEEQFVHDGTLNVFGDEESKSCSSNGSSEQVSIDLENRLKANGILKANGQTILMTVQEQIPESQEGFAITLKDYQRLVIENKKLRDRLHSLRLDFDERVTPYRELFAEQRKLREQAAKIQNERQQIEETLASVQQRTRTAVAISMQKSKVLQSKLAEVMKENEMIPKLQSQLDDARREIERLKKTSKK
jgi:chromosome segregation ATPase